MKNISCDMDCVICHTYVGCDYPWKEKVDEKEDEKMKRYKLEVKLSKDGNAWCALVGENLQCGFAGFGDTPFKALSALGVDLGKGKYVDVCDFLAEEKP